VHLSVLCQNHLSKVAEHVHVLQERFSRKR
jgi:hypothetical protein